MNIFAPAAAELKSLRDTLCYLSHHALFAETPEERQEAHQKAISVNNELRALFTNVWQQAGAITDYVRSPGEGNLLLSVEGLIATIQPATKMGLGSQAVDYTARVEEVQREVNRPTH